VLDGLGHVVHADDPRAGVMGRSDGSQAAAQTVRGLGAGQLADEGLLVGRITAKLKVPRNSTLIFLPSRSLELNPVENVWQYLRDQPRPSGPC